MEKKMNNKGFSLVELIIVIAIMAVLVGLLAPQYLKYVHNSKVSTDVSNAQAMASAINIAVADAKTPLTVGAGPTDPVTVTWANTGNTGGEAVSKLGGTWAFYGDNSTGVSKITLTIASGEYAGTYVAYPNPENTTDGLSNKCKKN